MTLTKTYTAQKRYREKNKRKGVLRVTVGVPEKYTLELKEIAAAMRSGSWED